MLVGKPLKYQGHVIEVHRLAIDFACYVDGKQLPNYFIDSHAASAGGMRYVDDLKKEEARRDKQNR